ncbi:MAG: CBS domain-containing protein [Anaerolineales bacterium]|nr:CBS domain-containing protein [Anaerolineales bacterium]
MDIILTHERTDFDGLASLLGAYKLDQNLVPVLPRLLNRNVEAFLTLYGVELPFMDPRDLSGDPIESVCLVDTQSMTSIKGMVKNIKVQVIDHHQTKEDFPEDWEVTIRETGATTTIFVQAIQERDILLTPVEATLLLLGIYEDTGSLTYTRTIPEDIFAAGILLERGASLAIVTDYINHPLSMAQQCVYEDLRANAESLIIHGHSLILAQADASDLEEELSSLAHKLRDLLDPDALFLLLNTSGGVQIIARSTSDHIDVNEVLSTFEGGGGHPRAAAALVHDIPLPDIYKTLTDVLPQYIKPAIRAQDIMSKDPQTLAPDTPISEVAELMLHYGFEGYPVVDQDEIVGLVTRRSVDRALAHKLDLTAESIMEAGNVRVFPADSIEYIQDVMMESGWGQIPVVSSRSKKIVGIITRTDLIKILAPHRPTPGRQNLSHRLESTLPEVRLALINKIADVAAEQKSALYIVGGFVRDLLLDIPSLDFDLVVEGDAIALAKAVQQQYGGRVTSHNRFGTAKWSIDKEDLDILGSTKKVKKALPESLDFISARREFYTHPTALPTVAWGSIKLDLHRRDFTINTLAMRLDGHHYGELFDYWGGLADLKAKQVKVLHSLSFVDDPTRILRAVRYEQRYDFNLDKRTENLLLEAKELLKRVSGDRIRHEFDRIFEEKKAAQMLDRLNELTILETIHPHLIWNKDLKNLIESMPFKDTPPEWDIDGDGIGISLEMALHYSLWLMNAPVGSDVSKRLRLVSGLAGTIRQASELRETLADLDGLPASEATAILGRISNLAIYSVYLNEKKPKLKGILSRYLSSWQHMESNITGKYLQEQGLAPGPRYAQILSELRNAWLDGKITTKTEEKKYLNDLLREGKENSSASEGDPSPEE